MKTTRMILCMALAPGIGGLLWAQEPEFGLEGRGYVVAVPADLPSPDATGLYQGIVGISPNPPAKGDWPCWGGTSKCSSVPVGGLVIGEPSPGSVPHNCTGCAQVYWTYQTTTSSGAATLTVKITQGSTTIYHKSFSATVTANTLYAASVTGITLTGASAGAATITVTTKVGSTTVTGKATITLI